MIRLTTLTLTLMLILSISLPLASQSYNSYSGLEEQLTKKTLTYSDSMAFRLQAEQKVNSLFEYARLYNDSSLSLESREYIIDNTIKLFRIGDTLSVDKVGIQNILGTLDHRCYFNNKTSIAWLKQTNLFGLIYISSCNVTIPSVLQRSTKNFGTKSKDVWLIKLHPPL
jgi:hypothetical protein